MGCGASTAAPGAIDAKPTEGKAPATPTKNAKGSTKEVKIGKDAKGGTDMKALFAQFDADGDGKLDIYEIARSFRALGLEKRDGEKADMDKAMFKCKQGT